MKGNRENRHKLGIFFVPSVFHRKYAKSSSEEKAVVLVFLRFLMIGKKFEGKSVFMGSWREVEFR
jgi:hypothetical protein